MFYTRKNPANAYDINGTHQFNKERKQNKRIRANVNNIFFILSKACISDVYLRSMNKVKCPMCLGSGHIYTPEFKQKLMPQKVSTAKRMREQGYSIREIMRAMKYKSTRSVTNLLEK